ncbi:MAG: cell division protein FtsQ/DivIB, partial [Cyclobacteriaceae bacterium]
AIFGASGFAEKKYDGKTLTGVSVEIENQYDNYFLDENEIKNSLQNKDTNDFIGTAFSQLNFRELETKLKHHKFVEEAQLYHDPKGNLTVKLNQSQPIARLLRPENPDAYIGSQGQILPTSEAFTARVMVITGPFVDTLAQEDLGVSVRGRSYLELLHFIDADPFWKAQIAQIQVDKKGEVILYPQLSKQYVEFGRPMQIEEKFKRMMIFYQQILPEKGWNTYEKVNLKYENQIICE